MEVGNESINKQRDTNVVSIINRKINNVFSILKIQLPDIAVTNNDKAMSYEAYDKNKRSIKKSVTGSNFDDIGKLLSKRFGINIVLEDKRSGLANLTGIVMPPLNYKLMNIAMNSMDSIFPKRKMGSITWDMMASSREKKMYGILNDLKQGLENSTIEIDLENAYIKGLDNSTFVINMDILSVMIIGLTVEETTSLLLHEVGHIFTYIEYITSTTNATKVLADSFLTERFNKNTEPIKSFKLAIENADPAIKVDTASPVKVLESLDAFILKTYRIDNGYNSIVIDFDRMADQFSARFGVGDLLASAIVKIASHDIVVSKTGVTVSGSGFFTFFKVMAMLLSFVMAILFFNIFGLLVVLLYVSLKLISYVLALIVRFIYKIFSAIFMTDIAQDVHSEDIIKRLTKIKLELIRQLRSVSMSDTGKELVVDQIEVVKDSIKRLKVNFGVLAEYSSSTTRVDYSKMEDINFMTEILQENELHLMQEKFKIE